MDMEKDASKMFDWYRSDQPAAGVGGSVITKKNACKCLYDAAEG
jgi:hypothetical protein